VLKKGTHLHKIRDKGVGRGIKAYPRRFRLDVSDLRVTYSPSKKTNGGQLCVGGEWKTICDDLGSSLVQVPEGETASASRTFARSDQDTELPSSTGEQANSCPAI